MNGMMTNMRALEEMNQRPAPVPGACCAVPTNASISQQLSALFDHAKVLQEQVSAAHERISRLEHQING